MGIVHVSKHGFKQAEAAKILTRCFNGYVRLGIFPEQALNLADTLVARAVEHSTLGVAAEHQRRLHRLTLAALGLIEGLKQRHENGDQWRLFMVCLAHLLRDFSRYGQCYRLSQWDKQILRSAVAFLGPEIQSVMTEFEQQAKARLSVRGCPAS